VIQQEQLPGAEDPLAQVFSHLERWLKRIERYTVVRWPIYVPSRGRAGRVKVTKKFDQSALPYAVVIEPKEWGAYAEHYPDEHLLVLDRADAGIAYSRNFIRDHAEQTGHEYHWQFDDNVHAFLSRARGKRDVVSARNALSFIEHAVEQFSNIGAASFAHWAFAFSYDSGPIVALNNQVYCAELLRTDVQARFRTGTHEDTDYSLQLLTEGWCTLVFKRLVMDKTSSGQMSGGNTDSEYAGDGRCQRYEQLLADWPDAGFRIIHDGKRYRLTPSQIWRRFPQRPEPAR